MEDLPKKHVDTGAGLERIATILQGKTSNYDTDLFLPIIDKIQNIAGSSYTQDPIPHRVIADHLRMLCFSIADGALPSNDGRGYVLRRILRRAARFGRKIGLEKPFLHGLVDTMGEMMGELYPEVLQKKSHIQKVLLSEEESFGHTLDRGLNHFEKIFSDNAFFKFFVKNSAVPSAVLRATFPVKPSVTITLLSPLVILFPSI